MTTPPSQAPVPPPPPYAPQPSPPGRAPGRSRRWGIVAVVVVALLGAGLGGWWWSKDGDDDPLAGRPWATDLKAGVSYRLPEGWKRDKEDLVDAFTSSIRTEAKGEEGEDSRFGMVLTGRGGAVAESDLKAQTERAARSNAEFFNPDGSAEQTESEPTTVGGHPAHTVVLVMKGGEGGETHLRLTVISADAARSVFLMGVAKPGAGDEQETADAVLESAKVL
ncbi:hypothetical protein [Streptomyces spectabilis]|uniref:Uncharacterized protein n=1 Tax=Streptomyces spectabilis TaxID=68270 RepID=A0A516R837_STRST|nr:hypothetical protein [Streptomyces spectabilis]QDQ11823.1 hypothetical protein FH965_15605 [Streptomyces spectabilis]